MRAIWTGHIRFSLVTIPIRLYSAIDSNETVSFNQLHKEDSGRVGYDKKCKKCGKSLTAEEIVKGFEYEPDQYAIVEPDDFAKVKIKSTKIIEIEGFVKRQVTKFGNSAKVSCPKEFLDKEVYLVIVKNESN